MKDFPRPKLAREYLSVDCYSDSDDDSSLEISAPMSRPRTITASNKASGEILTNARSSSSTHEELMAELLESSSDDDELLRNYKPIFPTTKTNTLPMSRPTAKNSVSYPQSGLSRKRNRDYSAGNESSTTLHQVTKEDAKARRDEERARRRVETERRKHEEKLARQQQRKRDKEKRDHQKQVERNAKEKSKNENQQAAGRFSQSEIVLLLDPVLFQDNNYGIALSLEEDFMVKEYQSQMSSYKTVQWVRKEFLDGGALGAWNCLKKGQLNQIDHSPHFVVVMTYDDYVPLIQRIDHDEDNDYPKLEEWLIHLKLKWQQGWSTTKEPRITLLLDRVEDSLERAWAEKRKANAAAVPSLPSDWELRDSLQWLLVQFCVDCILCSSADELLANIHKFTQAVAEAPYANLATELECIRKIKPGPNVGDDSFSKAQDTWFRQLQMIPGVSEQRARKLIEYFPTMQSLYHAYQSGDKMANPDLLSGCFGDKANQNALSLAVYKAMTSNDPAEML